MSDHTIKATYQFPGAVLSSAAVVGRILGPKGKTGHLLAWGVLCTTSLTGSAGQLNIGKAGEATAYATLTLPNTTAPARVDGLERPTYGAVSRTLIDPDTIVEIAATADPTAGAGTIFITIEWR
jgi:hypothetical protein